VILNANEIKSRVLLFSKTWADASNEAKPFWIDFLLDARAQFSDASLADLYDPLTIPPALLKAHQKLDAAVDATYQPSGGKKSYASDAEHAALLFDLYQRITSSLPAPAAKKTREAKVTES
jgi:hypothetical protein